MTNQESMNRRKFTRVPVTVRVEAVSGSANAFTGEVKDLSLRGVYVVCDNPPPIGTECRVLIELQGRETPVPIRIAGKVARVDAAGAGVEFTEVEAEDFEDLRNLVTYNAEDADKVEDEFRATIEERARSGRS